MAGTRKPGPIGGGEGGEETAAGRPSIASSSVMATGLDGETAALWGMRTPWNVAGRPFFASGEDLVDQLLRQLKAAVDIVDLQKLAERLLGPQAFSAGVLYGAGESFVMSVVEMAEMLKIFVMADLHDQAQRSARWSVLQPMGVARYLTAQVLDKYFGEELADAARQRNAIFAEISYAFQHPREFFGSLAAEYSEKFRRFMLLSGDPSLASQFQAGCIFGELLLEVLAVVGGATAAAKMAAKIPRLASLAKKLKGKIVRRKMAGGEGTSELTPSRPQPQTPAAGGAPKARRFTMAENKNDYFFGKVKPPDEALKLTDPKKFKDLKHNYDRSQQLKKVLGDIGIEDTPAGREKLLDLFEKGMDSPELAKHAGDFGTTVTRAVDEGSTILEIKYFYEGGDMTSTPKVVTLIPKVKK